ncbi:MAG: hypothetical protein AAGI37_18410 [Planctomycetota bacterium]
MMMPTTAISRLSAGVIFAGCLALTPTLADADARPVTQSMPQAVERPIKHVAYARNEDEHKVDTGRRAYDYDFGPARGPVMENWTPLTHKATGDIYWSGATRLLRAVAVPKREGVNNANTDYVTSRSPITFNHKIANGTWRITMNMGDARRGHDQMGVRAEGELISDAIDSDRLEFAYVSRAGGSQTPAHFDIEVKDGELNIELFDNGGRDRYWVLTRISLKKIK